MLSFISKGITRVFGTKSDRDLKSIMPIVSIINNECSKLGTLSDDELRGRTDQLKRIINEDLENIDKNIQKLKGQIVENPSMGIHEKENIFNNIDSLEEERDKHLESVLMKILPEAFAVVRETARRLTVNKKLEVKATEMDRDLSKNKTNVKIDGDKAIWANEWIAAGTKVIWNMVHYDVQLIGGIVLHQGKISEMATGEGKTLVATLPAYLNALAGRGIHIVTVNNYLAKRDSEWNAPIFQFHGLTVSCIDNHNPNSPERRAAYRCDIVYGTNNEFGFDYLRDNMARDPEELVQGKHHFAMVDEVDSVLIDDARTPLIISGPIPRGDEHEFYDLKPRIQKLVDAQKRLTGGYLNEAKNFLKSNDEKKAGLPLFRVYRGLPKYKPLIKYLSESGIRQVLQKTENHYLQDNQKMMPEADDPLYFVIDEKNNTVDLTEKGIDLITGNTEDNKFFILPDIGEEIAKLENESGLNNKEILKKKDEIIKDYNVKSQRIHSVNQLLKAYCLYEKDTEYIVVDEKVKIVDEQTGRVMEGRRYSDGLHQAIEAKENVKVEDATQTYATVTLQNYFRMYHKLAGMTGTAETESGEFWDIYKLDVIVVPTNKSIVRKDMEDKVYKTMREKFKAVVDEIIELTSANRPVLVGTTSVEISELLSKMLALKKIKHQVLNAKQHDREADIVAEAGKPKTVTIATNMAGRGTDIKLTQEARKSGGLAIIGTERHESRRVDRQLRGRAGRQGDVGSSQFFVSLEDNLMRLFGFSERMPKIMDRLGLKEGEVIQHSMITKSIERAQKKVEENNFAVRKRLLEYDDVMNSQREVIYKRRRNALYGERLQLDIMNMIYDVVENTASVVKIDNNLDNLKLTCISAFGIDIKINQEELNKINETELTERLYDEVYSSYLRKNEQIVTASFPILNDIQKTKGQTIKNILIPFTDGKKQIGVHANLNKCVETGGTEMILEMEKMSTLSIIDQSWKEHLRDMDDLKQSVQNAVYEQKDPLLIYKFEGFDLFKQFLGKVNEEAISFLSKAAIPVNQAEDVKESRIKRTKQHYKESKEESRSALSYNSKGDRPPVEKPQPMKSQKTIGRNERITVEYKDGTLKENVKFKTVEQDVADNKCTVVEK